jgi:hypothetical protein
LNILVCHHPPTSHSYFGENAYDFISGGGELLTQLENHGPWLVVHGHKHHGHISYAPGGGRAPVVFAASSLSARLTEIKNGFRNQFYLIELEDRAGDLYGSVQAWDWFLGQGFQRATPKNGGIFDGCGFGWRRSPAEIAAAIAAKTAGQLPMSWGHVRVAIPELAHVLPLEYPHIEQLLASRYSLVIEKDSHEAWDQVAKAAP